MSDAKFDKRDKPRSHLEHIPRRSLFVEASAPDTRKRVTEIVEIKSPATIVTKTPEVSVTAPRSKGGRPKSAKATTPAERQRAARQRRKAEAGACFETP